MMESTTHPVKDEEKERPIPVEWRSVFRDIINSFVLHDYALKSRPEGVLPVSAETARQIAEYISDYGEELVELHEDAWKGSTCIWMGEKWEVLIDLWTKSEGRSDLVLSAKVSESEFGYVVDVYMVYVP